jgi:pyruvate-formate lyase-activating enzyme
MSVSGAPLYHVTTLSNFARAFDKYSRRYCKSRIPESSHPNESYLLPETQLSFGIAKASRLVSKLAISGDAPLALQAGVSHSQVDENARTGIGLVWRSPDLPISGTFAVAADGKLGAAISFEDAMARSLELHSRRFAAYSELRPRTLSFLPIARGCQAACPFCFSEASASVDQMRGGFELGVARQWAEFARARGALRAVITGGGEPTLLPWEQLIDLVRICSSTFPKTVLITNGAGLASRPKTTIIARIRELANAGLSVLAVSRHHASEDVNSGLMRFRTMTPALLEAYAEASGASFGLACRLICVLQKEGIASEADVQNYVEWATSLGVEQVCFKELYVSTSRESVYFSRAANSWSAENQVPLSVVHAWAAGNGMRMTERLPWGAPIFSGAFRGRRVRVAAYTEPSLFWERSNGLARSWNVMADGQCLASLEDRRSIINLLPCEELVQ